MRLFSDIAKICLDPQAPMREAVATIDRSGIKIALAVDPGGRLLGTVTDGDVRRALLRGCDLDTPLSQIMSSHPKTASASADPIALRERLVREEVLHLPLVDEGGRVVDIAYLPALDLAQERQNRVVIMAGGLGTRLRPITEQIPKPMVEVGGRPLLQIIIETFVKQGFGRFTIALNYLGEIIEEHFGDGSRFGAEIEYVRETKRLGTAGALSLMPERPSEPFVVMNGDILTNIDFRALISFHEESNATATMAVNSFRFQVPYGVVDLEHDRITGLREKPEYEFFVNAGVYVLSPPALDLVESDTFLDMPTLFARSGERGWKTVAFPLRETWLDVGQHADLQRAEIEVHKIFSPTSN
jgi:dTDP-glucose pyrophosphorylase